MKRLKSSVSIFSFLRQSSITLEQTRRFLLSSIFLSFLAHLLRPAAFLRPQRRGKIFKGQNSDRKLKVHESLNTSSEIIHVTLWVPSVLAHPPDPPPPLHLLPQSRLQLQLPLIVHRAWIPQRKMCIQYNCLKVYHKKRKHGYTPPIPIIIRHNFSQVQH